MAPDETASLIEGIKLKQRAPDVREEGVRESMTVRFSSCVAVVFRRRGYWMCALEGYVWLSPFKRSPDYVCLLFVNGNHVEEVSWDEKAHRVWMAICNERVHGEDRLLC